MSNPLDFRGTTILAVRKDGRTAIAGDGQVTLGNTVVKHTAQKVRKIYHDKIVVGFAGATADALNLFDKFEGKLEQYNGNLTRAAVELARDWRTDKYLRKLEAMMIAVDGERMFLISGNGDIIEPDEGVIGIGSGGPFAQAAGHGPDQAFGPGRSGPHSKSGHGRGCVHLHLHQPGCHPARDMRIGMEDLKPREIVQELDKYIIGQDHAKRFQWPLP